MKGFSEFSEVENGKLVANNFDETMQIPEIENLSNTESIDAQPSSQNPSLTRPRLPEECMTAGSAGLLLY